jgi:hypothetical protein
MGETKISGEDRKQMAQTKKIKAVGSRREVMSGSAKHTSGGLKKKDLMMHKGRIVSRKAHAAGKKAIKRLFSLGYKPKKGKFVAMRKSMVDGRKRRHSKKRGGAAGIPATLASGVDGALSSLLKM